MPELSESEIRKKYGDYTMSKAHANGQLVKVTCQHCRLSRRYRCDDIAKLCGDVSILLVARRFRCESCRLKEYMHAKLESPMTSELAGMKIRRLVKIVAIRRPIWEDVIL